MKSLLALLLTDFSLSVYYIAIVNQKTLFCNRSILDSLQKGMQISYKIIPGGKRKMKRKHILRRVIFSLAQDFPDARTLQGPNLAMEQRSPGSPELLLPCS